MTKLAAAYKSPASNNKAEDFNYLHHIGADYEKLSPAEESYLLRVLKGRPVHTLETLINNKRPRPASKARREEARNFFIAHNIRLVISMALEKKKHFEEEVLHLIEEGFIGLIMAVDKYSLNKKTIKGVPHRFSTFAFHWIRCHISKEFKKHLRPQKDKRTKIITKFNQARKLLQELFLSTPTNEEVFAFLNWTPATIERFQAPAEFLIFRDIDYINEEEQEKDKNMVCIEDPLEEQVSAESSDLMFDCLQILSKEEAFLVIFHDCWPHLKITFKILAIAYEKTEKEVKEMHRLALNKLYRYLVSQHRDAISNYL